MNEMLISTLIKYCNKHLFSSNLLVFLGLYFLTRRVLSPTLVFCKELFTWTQKKKVLQQFFRGCSGVLQGFFRGSSGVLCGGHGAI